MSARRETFAVDQVTSGALEYVDTPGVAGGNAQHEAAADHAPSLTDALLAMLPPQLVTTGAEHLRPVATGSLFGPCGGSLFPHGALRVVVGRTDEAGIGPGDNPDGYRDHATTALTDVAGRLPGRTAAPFPLASSGQPRTMFWACGPF